MFTFRSVNVITLSPIVVSVGLNVQLAAPKGSATVKLDITTL